MHLLHQLTAATLLTVLATAAIAVQRTFVATTGDDANTAQNCSLAAPCRSFGSALSVTTAGGEIVALDSGGYGRVTIDKSVTIQAPSGVYAGISVFIGNNGVDIDTAGVSVVLRGLTITGQGGAQGVNATRFALLTIEDCTISGMAQDGVRAPLADGSARLVVRSSRMRNNGGIGVSASGAVTLHVEQTRIESNELDGILAGDGVVGVLADSSVLANVQTGVSVQAQAAATHTRFAVVRSVVSGNFWGVLASAADTGYVEADISDSVVEKNSSNGIRVTASGSAAALDVAVRDSVVSRNGADGIVVRDANARLVASRNTIVGNANHGLAQTFASSLLSSGDNVLQGNNGGAAQTLGVITPLAGI